MPYHSKIAAQSSIGNVAMLPFRTKFRGPITNYPESDTEMDIIDETLYYFRPNVFFKSFEIQSNSDRVLIYLTLYIIECLKRLQRLNTREQALADMHALAISRFDLPGDPGFPLNAVYSKPANPEEQELMRQYFLQLRQECGLRLVDRVFATETGKPSKWWICFAKRKFMDISLAGIGK